MKTQIRTQISVQAALAAGSPEHGEIIVEPTAEQLASLDEAKRVQLAPYVVKPRGQDYVRHLTVTVPGWAGVVAGLAAAIAETAREAAERAAHIEHERASYRAILAGGYYVPGVLPLKPIDYPELWTLAPNYSKDDADAKRLWTDVVALKLAQATLTIREADGRLGYDVVGSDLAEPIRLVLDTANRLASDLRVDISTLAPNATAFHARFQAEQEAAKAAREKSRTDAIREIVAADGAPDQLERLDAGVLPERELNDIIEARLFAPFAKFAPFADITEAAVAEECECETDDVKFTTQTSESGELDADEYATLKALRAAAPEGAVIEMREHVGYQAGRSGEDDPEIRRYGLRVTVEFAGRKWRREFAM